MAQGQLFVASDVGGHKELIEHNKTGILFKAGDRDALVQAVLKLLDEECKIPKGSDTFYLEKQHAGLGAHPNYIKGKDQRRHGIEFGILHFAGAVTYTVDGFLMKNKDVDQALLFDMMRDSTDRKSVV